MSSGAAGCGATYATGIAMTEAASAAPGGRQAPRDRPPPEAVTAAQVAIYEVLERHLDDDVSLTVVAREAAVEALTATGPQIAAAERDRIRQLAEQHGAVYLARDGFTRKLFADLLAGDPP